MDNERLLVALATALAAFSLLAAGTKVDALLEPLVRAQPGFASFVIDEAVRRWSGAAEVEAPRQR